MANKDRGSVFIFFVEQPRVTLLRDYVYTKSIANGIVHVERENYYLTK